MHRRHPSPLELGAYFDGEPIEGVSEHVAHCRRCRESLDELRGVRCAVRGELDLTDGSARKRARWTVALIPVAASVALLLAMSAPPGGLPVTRVENADEAMPAALPVFTPPQVTDVTSAQARRQPAVRPGRPPPRPTAPRPTSPPRRGMPGLDPPRCPGRRRRRTPPDARRPRPPPLQPDGPLRRPVGLCGLACRCPPGGRRPVRAPKSSGRCEP